ncbi:MAG TPA: SusC/RagA family TonB-linked outer membrane protein, partial [Puia sp.]|nr:SusC/RagA family TonB-linked outer membrane protein [Puia sp.]
RGRAGRGNITLNSTTEFAQVRKKMPMLNGRDFANFRNDEAALQGAAPVYNLDSIQPINWQDAIFQTGVTTNNRLSIGGTGDRSNYFLAMGYLDNNGVIPTTGVKQGDIRFNFTQNTTDRLKFTSRTGLLYRRNSMTQATEQLGSASNSIIRSMLSKEPIVGTDSLSQVDISEGVDGPRAWLKDYDDFSKEFRALQSLSLEYKLTGALTFRVLGGTDLRFKDRHRWFGKALGQGQAANGQLGYSALKSYAYNTEAMLTFNKVFGKHRINATGGMTYDNSILENSYTVNEDFWTEDLRTHGLGTGARVFPYYEDNSQSSILSALSRVVYSYNDRYVLTVTGRYDGTSRFADGHKWGFFPSGALAWRASDEDFIKNLKIFSTLKPRIGFGITGNQAVAPYSTITRYAVDYYASNNSTIAVGAAPALIANKELKWESSQQTNVGLETGFFQDKLLFTIDLYHKLTKDLLQQMSLPTSTGFTSMYINRGSIENNGIELSAEAVLSKGTVQWSAGANIAFNRNRITNVGLPVGQFGNMQLSAFLGTNVAGGGEFKEPANIFAKGQPVGMFFGYKTRGIYQPADVAQHPLKLAGVPLQAGDIYFVDQNGDGNIDDADKTIIGNPNPRFTYGFHSSLTYQRFTLSAFVNGVYGNLIADGNKLKIDNTLPGTNVEQDAYFKAWSPKNPAGTNPRLLYYNGNFTDRILEDGSFLRLGLVTLSYKPSLPGIKWMSGLSVYVTGRNLLTLTHYSGFDPEVNSFTNDPLRSGVDWSSYPNSKSFIVGLNVNF